MESIHIACGSYGVSIMELTRWSSKGWYSEGNGTGLYLQNDSQEQNAAREVTV